MGCRLMAASGTVDSLVPAPTRPLRVVSDLSGTGVMPGETVAICPCLRGLPDPGGLWLAVLPIHDANAYLDDPAFSLPAAWAKAYVGVFALDRLRSTERIFSALKEKNVRRIVNLPSVSFVDGGTQRVFAELGFGPEAELAFLLCALDAGFEVAFCCRDPGRIPPDARPALSAIIVANDPGEELSIWNGEVS